MLKSKLFLKGNKSLELRFSGFLSDINMARRKLISLVSKITMKRIFIWGVY